MQIEHSKSNDQRLDLARDAKSLNLVEFWAQRGDIELRAPRSRVQPFKWAWSDIEPRLRAAAHLVPIEEAERRALVFSNPGLGGKPYISHTLFAAYSLYNPGETAPVHRHTPSASRFVLEGSGGYTTVGGEKLTMSRGDLILTPSGLWHDHGNEGQEAVIWVDVLNVPLVESLDATIFEF
jgi:gentisate 1,2-dioxygenase